MYFDRFDICEGWFIYLSENHSGQSCPLYLRLCQLQKWFKPSPFLTRSRLSENAQAILAKLEEPLVKANFKKTILAECPENHVQKFIKTFGEKALEDYLDYLSGTSYSLEDCILSIGDRAYN
jgi:hypothetical protein